ncbi:hypothetical protein Ciccas_011516 [Cichlidogyrus casuarinus]|uniref:Uncharacterized protein n=1 Tax=Cichlidogyrus casuarinus TaxID=1844966 RepID=A0ABD2PR22_9PLAT
MCGEFTLPLFDASKPQNYALQLLKRIAAMHFTWFNLRFSIGLYLTESIFYLFAIDPLPKFDCLQRFFIRGIFFTLVVTELKEVQLGIIIIKHIDNRTISEDISPFKP